MRYMAINYSIPLIMLLTIQTSRLTIEMGLVAPVLSLLITMRLSMKHRDDKRTGEIHNSSLGKRTCSLNV